MPPSSPIQPGVGLPPSSPPAPLRVAPSVTPQKSTQSPNTLNLRSSPVRNTAEPAQSSIQQKNTEINPVQSPTPTLNRPNQDISQPEEQDRVDVLAQERQQRVKATISQSFQQLYQQVYLENARQIVRDSNQEFEQFAGLLQQQERAIDALKPPSKALRDLTLLYTGLLDLADIILALRAVLYGGVTGVGALAGGIGAALGPALASLVEPILIVLDFTLDIPIFIYIWTTNRSNKKYIEAHENFERAIAAANGRLDRRQAFIDQKAEAVGQRIRAVSQQDSKKPRYSVSLIDRFKESRDRIRNLKERRKQSEEKYKKKLEFANKLVGKFKSGPIKKYGKTALRIVADLVVIIDLYPFRIQTTRNIFKDHKGYYDQVAVDDKNTIREELDRFSRDIFTQTQLAINTEETQDKLEAADASAGVNKMNLP